MILVVAGSNPVARPIFMGMTFLNVCSVAVFVVFCKHLSSIYAKKYLSVFCRVLSQERLDVTRY